MLHFNNYSIKTIIVLESMKESIQSDITIDKSDHTQRLKIKKEFQGSSSDLSSSTNTSEDQRIQKKVDLELYLHF